LNSRSISARKHTKQVDISRYNLSKHKKREQEFRFDDDDVYLDWITQQTPKLFSIYEIRIGQKRQKYKKRTNNTIDATCRLKKCTTSTNKHTDKIKREKRKPINEN
jgi:hypothetical protein